MLDSTGKSSGELELAKEYRIAEEFGRLIQKYTDRRNRPEALSLDSIDHVNKKKDLLNGLHSELLPLLINQLNTLAQSLIPSGLRRETERNIRLVLKTQSELEGTIDQIRSNIATLCSEVTYLGERRPISSSNKYRWHQTN
ncbi:hypothetical protein PtA15_5A899 [Puccinia triticina]|uniref:Uncharacterized protein n=1 Tax=Puccinia triticina TaxID=208348 RepID=A0ABY7CJM8_9BASI|nr:uncharacterized protein PtA15_5A899 [Puccinia triticina]WAQ85324.1 hypothetical protein PtA15_5A899 [Puccinia triticina]